MLRRLLGLLSALTVLAVVSQPDARGYSKFGTERPFKATVSFDLYGDYLIIVRGSAGPLKGLNFFLDTGTSPSVLDSKVAGKLHLNVVSTEIAVLSGNIQGGTAVVPTLQVGSIRKDNLPILVEDLSFLKKALPIQVDGIVGLDVLGQNSFVIDYISHQIRFGPVPFMPTSIPFQLKEGLAIVDATVNHAPVQLLLDTGASSLILFDQVDDSVSDGKAAGARPSKKNIGDFDRKTRPISFSLGDAEFGRESASIVHNHRDAGHDFDGLMSPAALGITRVAVDLDRKTLAFSREP